MADIFISYSRRDTDFVRRLHGHLTATRGDVWVDWEDIPGSAEWLAEIYRAIEAADAFLFVISPNSVLSEVCRQEIEHAVQHNKRFIPILYRPIDGDPQVDAAKVHPAIRSHNWILFTDAQDFDEALAHLNKSLDTDLNYVHAHTRLLVRALEWESKDRSEGYLLSSGELDEFRQWRDTYTDKSPKPTALQLEYLFTSEAARLRRRRRFIFGLLTALVIMLVLGVFSLLLTLQLREQQDAIDAGQATSVAIGETATGALLERQTVEAQRTVQFATQRAQAQQNADANSTIVSIRGTRDTLQVTLANNEILLTRSAAGEQAAAVQLTAINGQIATLSAEGSSVAQTATAAQGEALSLVATGTEAARAGVILQQTSDAQSAAIAAAPTQIAATITAISQSVNAGDTPGEAPGTIPPSLPPTWTPTASNTPSLTPTATPSSTPSPTMRPTASPTPAPSATPTAIMAEAADLPTAITRPDARVWSQPDVTVGVIVATLPTGTEVTLTGDPVNGIVRADTGDTGLWYPISQAELGVYGWVWEERLTLSTEARQVELIYTADRITLINKSAGVINTGGLEFTRLLPDGTIRRFFSDQWGAQVGSTILAPGECFEIGRTVDAVAQRPSYCNRQGWVVRDGQEWFWVWETGSGDRQFTVSFLGAVLATCPVVVDSETRNCAFDLTFPDNHLFVSANGSDANACNRPEAPCSTITGALAKASPGSTINVMPGVYRETLTLTIPITLAGRSSQQTVINGGGTGSTITVAQGAVVTLTRINITGGNSTRDGGGILNLGTLTLSSSVVTDNVAANAGGGIANFGALTLRTSTIANNYASYEGGVYNSPFGTADSDEMIYEDNNAPVQFDQSCSAADMQALILIGQACSDIERNSACYGYPDVAAVTTGGASFTTVGDQIPLADVTALTLSPLDTSTLTWGITVLNVQASRPDVLPGQAITLLAYGGLNPGSVSTLTQITSNASGAVTCSPISAPLDAEPLSLSTTVDGITVGR